MGIKSISFNCEQCKIFIKKNYKPLIFALLAIALVGTIVGVFEGLNAGLYASSGSTAALLFYTLIRYLIAGGTISEKGKKTVASNSQMQSPSPSPPSSSTASSSASSSSSISSTTNSASLPASTPPPPPPSPSTSTSSTSALSSPSLASNSASPSGDSAPLSSQTREVFITFNKFGQPRSYSDIPLNEPVSRLIVRWQSETGQSPGLDSALRINGVPIDPTLTVKDLPDGKKEGRKLLNVTMNTYLDNDFLD